MVHAVGGESGVSTHHLDGRHHLAAQGERGNGLEGMGDAHAVGYVDDVAGADGLLEADVGAVDGVGGGVGEGHGAAALTFEVPRHVGVGCAARVGDGTRAGSVDDVVG